MKKLLKMLGIAFLMMVMLCTSVFADESLTEIDSYSDYGYDAATFSEAAQSYHEQIDALTDEDFEMYKEYYAEAPEVVQGFDTYYSFKNSEDAFVEYGPYALYETGNGDARIYQVMQYESGYYCLVCGFDTTLAFNYLNLYKIDNLSADDEMPADFDIVSYELSDLSGNTGSLFVFDGEVLKGALGNTLIGLGIVFSVLVFISIIISLFKYISPDARKKKEKIDFLESNEEPVVATVANDNVKTVGNSMTDEAQLVAAITAAICTYEGVSSDSFVVKTIKKRKW